MIDILLSAFLLSVVLLGIHSYFGLEIIKRGIIFTDLAIGQMSALGAALSILFLRANKPKISRLLLLFTIACAAAFLVVKAFEWRAKFEHGLYPDAAVLLSKPKGEMLYFGLYFMMTGLHALHVIVGMAILSILYIWIGQKKVTAAKPALLENTVLYWHLVDMIWIFLFPLFYLIS